MSRQTTRQRWSSLVLVAVFLSLFMYYGLPGLAFRVGRAIEAGRHDASGQVADALPAQPAPEDALANEPPHDERAAFFARASQAVRPAVVRIDAFSALDDAGDETPPPQAGPSSNGEVLVARGCGVVIDRQGYVLTSCRVISGAREVHVHLAGHRSPFLASIAGSDAVTDLAVLKIDPPAEGLPVATLDDDGRIENGDFVMAVGNAYQPGEFLWVGSVSSCGRRATGACCDVHDCIQTTAVNPWNCGGPLVSLDGTIVGISTSLREPAGFPMGIAVHASTARQIAEQLLNQGRVSRGWLGVFIHKIFPGAEIAAAADLPNGALAVAVDYVVPHSSADVGGIRAGDVILKFSGAPFESALELRRRIAATSPRNEVTLTVLHAGRLVDRPVVIGLLPATPPDLPGEKEWGVRLLGHLSPDESKHMGVDHLAGVVVQAVKPRRKAKELSAHDVILSVNEIATPTLEAFCREVSRLAEATSSDAVTLNVSSNGVRKRVVIGE